jgi:hypothetical protein
MCLDPCFQKRRMGLGPTDDFSIGCNTLEVRRIHRRNAVKITIVVCLYIIPSDRNIGLIATIERLCTAITEVLLTNDNLCLLVTCQSATLISAAINAPHTNNLIAVSPHYVVLSNNCDHPDTLAQGLHRHAGNPVTVFTCGRDW